MGLRDFVPERFLEAAARSSPVRALVARGAAWSADAHLSRGELYPAARSLLAAWRYLGDEGIGAVRRDRVRALVERGSGSGDHLRPLEENLFLGEYRRRSEAARLRRRYAGFPLEDRLRLRKPRPGGDPDRQGNFMIVKMPDPATGERGAAFVMYTEGIAAVPAVFDLPRLAERYALVLEPSWWGYQDPRFLLYRGSDAETVVLAQSRPDYEFIDDLGGNIVPVRLGAGDWADPEAFRPRGTAERRFDVVMVSAWDPFKRHEVLFRALRRMRREDGRRLSVALVGYPLRWDRARVEALARRYGLADDCRFFERIPHAEVAKIVADARVMVLLSRREGANRAIYESFFCDTPVIVPRGHRGVNLDHITAQTGRLSGDEELGDVLRDMLAHRESFAPREWALEHTGWRRSTAVLNDRLRERALARGEPWTRDLAGRRNAPNLGYADPKEAERLAPAYDDLRELLLETP